MYSGKIIQEQNIFELESERRNPVLADLFHRMRYMDRRGSGLKKIVNETKKLYGYADKFVPVFYSTTSSFKVVLRNVNYNENQTGSRDSNGGINGGLKRGINGGLNETQQNIIGLISDNPLTTTQAIADSLNFTRRKVDYHISQLKRAGLVEREGAKKNGRWIVK